MVVLNLDTNHVSDLIRRHTDEDVRTVVRLLENGDAHLGLSLFHAVQLAHPSFQHWSNLKTLLEDVPIVLLQPREDIWEEEIASAVVRACSSQTAFTRRPPRVLARDASDWGDVPGPVGGGIVDYIEYFRERPAAAEQFNALGRHYVALAAMKRDAFVVDNPLGPLELSVNDHIKRIQQTNPSYGCGRAAGDIVLEAGGLNAFPSFQVDHELTVYQLLHESVIAKRGDVADQYIASYAPYVAVTVLDRATTHRVREAKLACAPRVQGKLGPVPAIVEQVVTGQLQVLPSTPVPNWNR